MVDIDVFFFSGNVMTLKVVGVLFEEVNQIASSPDGLFDSPGQTLPTLSMGDCSVGSDKGRSPDLNNLPDCQCNESWVNSLHVAEDGRYKVEHHAECSGRSVGS